MSQIFLCYTEQDEEFALQVGEKLLQEGFRPVIFREFREKSFQLEVNSDGDSISSGFLSPLFVSEFCK